jgi:hypothetical protein
MEKTQNTLPYKIIINLPSQTPMGRIADNLLHFTQQTLMPRYPDIIEIAYGYCPDWPIQVTPLIRVFRITGRNEPPILELAIVGFRHEQELLVQLAAHLESPDYVCGQTDHAAWPGLLLENQGLRLLLGRIRIATDQMTEDIKKYMENKGMKK